jgi:hypothetical protein
MTVGSTRVHPVPPGVEDPAPLITLLSNTVTRAQLARMAETARTEITQPRQT